MPSPPPGEQRHYNPITLDKWFTISCVLFLISLVWMFLQDYNREWRPLQKEFRVMDAEKTRAQMETERARIESSDDYQEARALLEKASRDVAARSEQLSAARSERHSLEKEYARAQQMFNFKKADLDAAKYKFEEADSHGHGDPVATRQAMEALTVETDALGIESEKAQLALAAKDESINAVTAEARSAERSLSKSTRQLDLLDRKLKALDPAEMSTINQIANIVRDMPIMDMANPYYGVRDKQLIIEGITDDVIFSRVDKVDRCMACHLGIAKTDFADEAQPFTAHPNLDLFLSDASPHPLKEFGCTSCHNGRGRGVSFNSTAHSPGSVEQRKEWEDEHDWHKLHHWEHPMYPLKYAEAGCLQCHDGQKTIPGADTLNLGLALVERAGCYGCHTIEPFAGRPKAGPSLRRIGSKTTQDWAYHWINNPKAFREHTWMPSFFNQSNNAQVKDRSDQEIKAMVAYLFNKSEDYALQEPPEGDATHGEELVRSLGCLGCHNIDPERVRPEIVTLATLRSEHGPALTGLGDKTTAEWVYNWVRNPTGYHTGTRMPDLRVTDQEAADIAAYLCGGDLGQHAAFGSTPVPETDATKLKEITLDYMSSVMTLAQARKSINAMTEEEMVVGVGERLIRHYGCFGCHDIPGFENEPPIGTDLTEEGSKPVVKLDFGNLHGEVDHVNHAWFNAKLQNPRVFDKGKEKIKGPRAYLKMPNFHLTQQETDALVTVMLGLRKNDPGLKRHKPRTPENLFVESGENLVRALNCQGCHELENGGGDIRASIADWYRDYKVDASEDDGADDEWGDEEDDWGDDGDGDGEQDAEFLSQVASFSPPLLLGEGRKVQPDWLFHFLEDPSSIRPWLKVRMPTFNLTDDERNTFIKYFNYLDGESFPFAGSVHPAIEGEQYEAGKRLFSGDVFQCQRCHISGDEMPAGTPDMWAPNLQAVASRLKPQWVLDWLLDPQAIIPGTKMPGYFPDGGTSQPDLDADAHRQMVALRDYLLTLGSDSE